MPSSSTGVRLCEVAQQLGIDVSPYRGPIIPVVYNLNLRDPAGYFLATKFQMRNKDVVFVSNALVVEAAKAMNYFRLVTATVNDPIITATNAFVLRNTALGGATIITNGVTSPIATPVVAPTP